jgi:hypothetical protein
MPRRGDQYSTRDLAASELRASRERAVASSVHPADRSPADGFVIRRRWEVPVKRVRWKLASALVLAVLVAVPAAVPAGAATSSGVVDVKTKVLGKSYADWSAAWWQWVFGTDARASDVFANGGVDCGYNQPNPQVLFLAGPFNSSGTINRTCDSPITTSTYVFLPVLNIECSDLEVGTVFYGATAGERRQCAKRFGFADMHAAIDGRAVANLDRYAVTSPDFTFTGVPGNAGGVEGTGSSTSYGVWLMLQPLSAGPHKITFGGYFPDFGYTLDVTYHITVD